MQILRIILLLAFVSLATAQPSPGRPNQWGEIETYLDTKPEWKIKNADEARKAIFDGFSRLGAKGISAYWSWGIRDAVIAPADIEGLASKGDVLWIGEYKDINNSFQPFAFVFLNARTGSLKVIGELPK
jgi:hypothetical protein